MLDLALRQADAPLGDVVGREYRPVRFVVSTRGDVRLWREHYPDLEFKIDPEVDWTREHMDELASTGCDSRRRPQGVLPRTVVDVPADHRLYRDVVEAFSDSVIEDAFFTDETRPILAEAAERLSFDAPIHSVDDVLALEVEPRFLNIKPSRFGTAAAARHARLRRGARDQHVRRRAVRARRWPRPHPGRREPLLRRRGERRRAGRLQRAAAAARAADEPLEPPASRADWRSGG